MVGLTIGASIAVFKGSPIGRTSLSCALSGTACFGTKRIADNAIRLLSEKIDAEIVVMSMGIRQCSLFCMLSSGKENLLV